mmetsp:Transcript_984/g.2695  ORF Transcript_984/g.2695 Transcript_984/m.2695 type:complete len:311 (+) Transcript_984:746-1678(+)
MRCCPAARCPASPRCCCSMQHAAGRWRGLPQSLRTLGSTPAGRWGEGRWHSHACLPRLVPAAQTSGGCVSSRCRPLRTRCTGRSAAQSPAKPGAAGCGKTTTAPISTLAARCRPPPPQQHQARAPSSCCCLMPCKRSTATTRQPRTRRGPPPSSRCPARWWRARPRLCSSTARAPRCSATRPTSSCTTAGTAGTRGWLRLAAARAPTSSPPRCSVMRRPTGGLCCWRCPPAPPPSTLTSRTAAARGTTTVGVTTSCLCCHPRPPRQGPQEGSSSSKGRAAAAVMVRRAARALCRVWRAGRMELARCMLSP